MAKRVAAKELTRDNWDQEDPDDHEEMGAFKVAAKDVIEKRVIRTAKRRSQASGDESKKSVFSGFGGFNKSQPSSFDFLANLTNGNKNTNGSSSKNETAVTSSLFSSKPATTSGSLFASSTFGGSPLHTASPFTSPATKTDVPSVTFTGSKAETTLTETPIKNQLVSNSPDSTQTSKPQVTSNIFGVSATSANKMATNTTIKQPASSTSIPVQNSSIIAPPAKGEASDEAETEKDKARNKYYSKLKGLNESVVGWITKHVEKTPLCFLSPIFKDYENYLKEIKDEYEAVKDDSNKKMTVNANQTTKTSFADTPSLFGNSKAFSHDTTNKKLPSEDNSNTKSLLGKSGTTGFSFGITSTASTTSASNKITNTATPTKGFSFGITSTPSVSPLNSSNTISASSKGFSFGKTSSPAEKPATNSTPSKGFSFGTSTPSTAPSTNSSPFAEKPSQGITFGIPSTATSPTNPFAEKAGSQTSKGISFGIPSTATSPTSKETPAPFSFGLGSGKPFSFNSQVQQSTEPQNNEKEDEEPPKVEYTPIVEENSVFDKRCKIFVKKDGNFADKGVGTLYIKKIEESGKHQLLVRANTNLGTVLLNMILSSGIPTQRMGKNNVMLVCIPTPDAEPPPTPILIRVKTGEEADDLLETLNKYKS